MIARLGFVLLFLTGIALAFAWISDWGFSIPLEKAVKADLITNATPARVNGLILSALERDDIEEADMYVEIAKFLERRTTADEAAELKAT